MVARQFKVHTDIVIIFTIPRHDQRHCIVGIYTVICIYIPHAHTYIHRYLKSTYAPRKYHYSEILYDVIRILFAHALSILGVGLFSWYNVENIGIYSVFSRLILVSCAALSLLYIQYNIYI